MHVIMYKLQVFRARLSTLKYIVGDETNTFGSFANLGEGNSVTKPLKLDFALTHQGCCCKTNI